METTTKGKNHRFKLTIFCEKSKNTFVQYLRNLFPLKFFLEATTTGIIGTTLNNNTDIESNVTMTTSEPYTGTTPRIWEYHLGTDIYIYINKLIR